MIEDDIDKFIQRNRKILEERKDCSWPINYEIEEELFQYLKTNRYYYYKIQSAYGINRWVIADEMYIKNVKDEKY